MNPARPRTVVSCIVASDSHACLCEGTANRDEAIPAPSVSINPATAAGVGSNIASPRCCVCHR